MKDNKTTTTTTKQPFRPKSFMNPELQVTENLYAVSYVKLSNEHIMAIDNFDAAKREHAFLIIQTHKKIYRAEVAWNRIIRSLVVENIERPFSNKVNFAEACTATLKEFTSEEAALDKAPLYHWTWLVSKEKVAELLVDIEQDIGEDRDNPKPFPYFLLGNESIFCPGVAIEFAKEMIKDIAYFGGIYTAALKADKAARPIYEELEKSRVYKAKFSEWINSMNRESLLPCSCELSNYSSLLTICAILTAAVVPMQIIRYNYSEVILPTKEVPKVHSCATWALEKLHNLNIPEINATLEPGVFATLVNQFAHITSFNVGDQAEALRATKVLTHEALTQFYEYKVPNSIKDEVINPYITMMKYGAEDMKKGMLIGGGTGSMLGGSSVVAACCMGKPGIGLTVVLSSSALGATTAVVGIEGIKQHATTAKELMNESWVERTQSRVLASQEEVINVNEAEELANPAGTTEVRSSNSGCIIF